VLQKLNCFRMNCQIALCNDGLMPILAMIADGRCAHLGYVLGYLRHGSLGRPAPGGPTDRAAWPPVRWRGLPVCVWALAARCAGFLMTSMLTPAACAVMCPTLAWPPSVRSPVSGGVLSRRFQKQLASLMPCVQLRFDVFLGDGFSFIGAKLLFPTVAPSHGHIPEAISILPSI
jgi:hypothetical protein